MIIESELPELIWIIWCDGLKPPSMAFLNESEARSAMALMKDNPGAENWNLSSVYFWRSPLIASPAPETPQRHKS